MKLLFLPALGAAASLATAAFAGDMPAGATALADAYARDGAARSNATAAPLIRQVDGDQIQVGRYTTLSTLADDAAANSLAVVATVHFPRGTVQSVDDAVRYLLIRTGYELAPVDQLDDRVQHVLGLRLPDSQRTLGPYRVDTMLGVLLGQPFQMVADALTRTVSYAVREAPHPPAEAAQPASSQPSDRQRTPATVTAMPVASHATTPAP